jgi:hypothetical protein
VRAEDLVISKSACRRNRARIGGFVEHAGDQDRASGCLVRVLRVLQACSRHGQNLQKVAALNVWSPDAAWERFVKVEP